MPIDEIREKDIGTRFIVTVKDEDGAIVDISAALVREIKFKIKSLAAVTVTAVLTNGGQDGDMEYKSVADFLTPTGKIQYQGFVSFADGSQFHSDIETDIIHPNLS